MYNKVNLQKKTLEELQVIAAEYGINASKMSQNDLIYEIIDHEASESAAQKAANEKPKKRNRIKTVDHVYSANQLKTKKLEKQTTVATNNSLFNDLSFEEKEMLKTEAEDEDENETETESVEIESQSVNKSNNQAIDKPTNQGNVVETQKKKRGRPKKSNSNKKDNNNEKTVIQQVDETKNDEQQFDNVDIKPKRSLFDFSKKQTTENKQQIIIKDIVKENKVEKEQVSAEALYDGSDFIILENIPTDDSLKENNSISFFDKYKNTQKEKEIHIVQTDNTVNEQNNNDKPYEEPLYTPEPIPYNFNDIIEVSGVLDLSGDFGFLRSSDYNYLSSPDDIYVNPSQVKHYCLKTGDVVEGTIRPPHEGEKYFPLVRINKINGCDPSVVRDRVPFEYLTPLFPEEKFRLCSGKNDSPSSRIVDLFSPIGKGQRALIVAQPKTGKTLLMKDIANSIAKNHPEAYLIMLLIDERPEEVTDMARTVNAEVIASTFDAPADNHVKIANLVLEKAKRMVECGHDVIIFLDSITRLARAYNTVSPASGKVLTGGVDANALQKPKRFFGAARNIEGGGSLTIIATALIDTGSKMDEVIFEEFKGTGNMELQLDRALSNKRIFPAVNLIASSTRRDDLLQDDITRRRMWIIRNHIADMTNLEAMDTILKHIERTDNNEEFLSTMNR